MVEPISIIVGALVVGAAAAAKNVGGKVVQDAYTGLKRLIADRYKRSRAVAALEREPSSIKQKEALEKALAKTKAGKDAEVVQLAKALAQALEKESQAALSTVGIQIDDLKAMNARFGDIDVAGSGIVAASLKNVDLMGNLRVGNVRVRNPK